MADYNRNPELLEKESARKGHPPRIIEDSLQALTREYVRQANRDGRYITLEMLSDYLKQHGNGQEFSISTLGRILDSWGFTFGKGTRSQHLKEKDYDYGSMKNRVGKPRMIEMKQPLFIIICL